MELKGKTIGFGITGSHCTYEEIFPEVKRLVDLGATVIPVFSNAVLHTDTRFGEAGEWAKKIEEVTGQRAISTIPEAEPLGPSKRLDVMLIAPCTASSLSRLAQANTDSAVLMAAKSTLRNDRPVVLGISTNDGLGLSMYNIARLMNTKNIYFVPFGQDAPHVKINSLVSLMRLIPETLSAALDGHQLQPVLLERWREQRPS
ncbi:dipicolinate synthase subunit B [Alicyclobacillus acidoterrestris]|uniref:Dipicolinate synthase subunit B n=1 Tax=Alicyclobacillus acidoterrestris (strain ATCC 49025 / DSM 3922 / CIP 106132 / NCIMB 13137 / GD3B) TaxID=1356854 RepID=T0BZJ3_ALIAG|nr:dipicolinate synthase subunit B [Alicyclobacillus acidoterrestris]EPZ46214.1 dihydrofolate reductase [Alicyclobacillus acidoterrestris ATCC 49025]UNO47153.1 dipicolinate synthase subunit B [Alicyclobacillus acidoterrestris]